MSLLPGLYPILDPDYCHGRDPVGVAKALLRAGVRTLQLRVKNQSPETVLGLAREISRFKDESSFTFIINDFLDVALACGADGLHIGQGDMPAMAARQALGAGRLLGLSTHSLDEVNQANDLPVDYIGFGAIFPTPTKGLDHPVPGIAALRQALVVSRHPIVAIGGITPVTLSLVLQTGVVHYAVLSALTQADDMEKRAREFLAAEEIKKC